MFPDKIFLGLSLYEILITIGIICGVLIFLKLIKSQSVPKRIQNLYLGIGLISLACGFLVAVVVQSFFDFLKSGSFTLTGATFLGGFIGGALSFMLFYKFKLSKKEKGYLNQFFLAVIPAILFSHFLGRIGCFMAGCCYGRETTSPLGVNFPHLNMLVHPTQLYEASILLILFIGSLIVFKYRRNSLVYYLFGYGIGRFILEFFRGDNRGQFIFGLSPSQVFALVLIISGVYILFNPIKSENIYKE